jgi:phospholipid/cholesterol/gamma-HCH transport system permease protein
VKKKEVQSPTIEIISEKEITTLKPKGLWLAKTAREVEQICQDILKKILSPTVAFDLQAFKDFDTTGVWVLLKTCENLKKRGHHVHIQNENESFKTFSSRFDNYDPPLAEATALRFIFGNAVVFLGKETLKILHLIRDLITFLGEVSVGIFYVLMHPRRIRIVSIISHMQRFGVNAIPIIILMSIALGLVLAYQGEDQLHKFGAEIYTINLVSISIVREVGILITAILVAGRTGSSITAQIGIMKINEEIDALNTLGLSPMQVLIVPRVLALILVMPCLAFISDLAGILGGGIMVVSSMDVSPQLYIYRIGEAITAGSFWVGLMKAPLFGAIIGLVSCFEGMRVSGTAESIGICTTRSVVEGIFLVTITDAFLSIFFVKIGV